MRTLESKLCIKCGKVFTREAWKMKTQTMCSLECQRLGIGFKKGHKINLGNILSEDTKKKISMAHTGMKKPWTTKTHLGKKLGFVPKCAFKKGSIPWNKGLAWLEMRGNKSPHWKGGVSRDIHSTAEHKYKNWRLSVFKRDGFKCRIANSDCKNYVQAHHILRWADYPELRYQINNGITLCLAHHPRKRAEEKRLIPTFQELVSVTNDCN